jgi:hypothetical protein
MLSGREEFISKKSFGSESDEIPEMQGVCGRSKSSKGTRLERDNKKSA